MVGGNNMDSWQKEIIPKWIEQAKTYPTKALLHTAVVVYAEQKRRLENEKGTLDGWMWSPDQWKEN